MGAIYRQLSPAARRKVSDIFRENYAHEIHIYDQKGGKEKGAEVTAALMEAAINGHIETAGEILRKDGDKIYSKDLERIQVAAEEAGNRVIRNKIDAYLEDAIREQIAVQVMSREKNKAPTR